MMTKNKRIFSMLLAIVMVVNLITPFNVFAAGAYGENYPPYSGSYPNTVIVKDTDGGYYAYQTASLIYYANDAKYLMVESGALVRRYVWKNNSWQADEPGYTYAVRNPIGRTVTVAGSNIEFYNITNDMVNGGMKTFTDIVDSNVNITNYNLVPDSTASLNQFSTPQEIANFGVAMMPSIYNLVTFSSGDTFESVREDFTLATQFTVGELQYDIEWESKSKSVLEVADEEFIGGTRAGVQNVSVHRAGVSAAADYTINAKVRYVGNPDVYASVVPAVKFRVEPMAEYLPNTDANKNKLWMKDVEISDFFHFDVVSGSESAFSRVIGEFHIGKGDGDVFVKDVFPVNIDESDASFRVWKASDSAVASKTGYYDETGLFHEGTRPYFNTYYSVDSTGAVITHNDFYETLYQEFVANPENRVVIEKVENETNPSMVCYTLADGRVVRLDKANSKEEVFYYDVINGNVALTNAVPTELIDSKGNPINKGDSAIRSTNDGRRNKMNQLGVVVTATINADDTWIVLPVNNSTSLNYAELQVVFSNGTEDYIYSAPFIVAGSGDIATSAPIPADRYTEITSTVSPITAFASASDMPLDISIDKYDGSNWTSYDVTTNYYDNVATEKLDDTVSTDIPGIAYNEFDPTLGMKTNVPGDGFIFKMTVKLNSAMAGKFNTNSVRISQLGNVKDIRFCDSIGSTSASWEDGKDISKSQLTSGATFYVFIPKSYIGVKENILDISWTNNVTLTFENTTSTPAGSKTYDNNQAQFTKKAIASSDEVITETQKNGFVITGYAQTGWKSSKYNKEYTFAAGADSFVGHYIVPYDGDTLTAVYGANAYTLSFDSNKGSGSTEPSTAPTSRSINYNDPIGAISDLTREGYTFDGWYTEVVGGDKVESTTLYKYTGDKTLYAHWTPIKYKVVFMNDTAQVDSSDVDFDTMITPPTAPTKAGYTFMGWRFSTGSTLSNTTFNSSVLALATGTPKTVTLTAAFGQNPKTITYNGNGGTPATFTVQITDTYSHPANNPTRDGFTFDGWWTQATGGTQVATGAPAPASNTTLYAHWTPVASGFSLDRSLIQMMAATNSLSIFSTSAMKNLYSTLLEKSTLVKAPRAAGDVTYNHMYLALSYPLDVMKESVWKVSANLRSLTVANPATDIVEIVDDVMETPYKEDISTIYTSSNGTWVDVTKNYFGIKVSAGSELSSSNVLGTIKSTIKTTGENLKVYFVGYLDTTNNSITVVNPVDPKNEIGGTEVDISTLTTIPNANNIALFYVCNTDRLVDGAGLEVSTHVENGGANGYSTRVFNTLQDGINSYSDKSDYTVNTTITATVPLSYKKNVAIRTAFATPVINAWRIGTSNQIGNITALLGDVTSTSIDMFADNSFNWDIIKNGLNIEASATESIFTSTNLDNDYQNSAYFVVSINNPNNGPATTTLELQNTSGTEKAEFVGYIALSGTTNATGQKDITFHKTSASNTFSLTSTDFDGEELKIFPIIRTSTLLTPEQTTLSPFGEGLNIKAQNYSLTLGSEVFSLPTEKIFKIVTFKVIKNTISSYVDRIASVTSGKENVPELGDYFFVKLSENDTLYDMAGPAKLVNSINNASIKWSVNVISGGSNVRLVEGTDYTDVNITRLGNTETKVEFVGNISYDANSMSSTKTIRIPAVIPAPASNLQTSTDYQNNAYQYVGGYIKIGNDIRVSDDSDLFSRFGGANVNSKTSLRFNIDKSQINDYTIFVTSTTINAFTGSRTNGFSIGTGANSFNLSLSTVDATAPIGSTASGNWIESHPNTLNFTDSFVVRADNYTRTNAMEVNFVPVDINEVRDGVVYKVKSYENSSLFLGKYPMPDVGSDNYIVMDYGEYVVLFTTTGQWCIDELGIHPDIPVDPNKEDNAQGRVVKAYVAPDWEPLTTLNGLTYSTVFENFNTGTVGDVSNILFSSKPLNYVTWVEDTTVTPKPGERPKYKKEERTIITPESNVTTSVPLYTRAFYAPNLVTDANNITRYNGNAVDLYKTSDLTYLAVDTADYETAYIYNATVGDTGTWTTTTLTALGITDRTTLNGFQRVSGTEEVKTLSDSLMPKAHISLPIPWNVTGGSDAYALDIYVDLYGNYHLTSTTGGDSEEYILNKYSWISYDRDLVDANGVAVSPIPDKYQLIAHYDKSDLNSIVELPNISWQAINVGSIPNLPRPPVSRENAIMVYDGSYKVYISDSPIYIDSNSKSIYSTTAAVLNCYYFGSMGWESYPNSNVTAQQGQDGNYYTGFYQGDVVWTNLDIMTEAGTLAMPGQGVSAFSYYADGFIDMAQLTGGQAEKEYYIWDKTSPTKSILFRMNPMADNIAPVLKPTNGIIDSAKNAVWNDTTHTWRDFNYEVDAFLPSHLGVYKFAKLYMQKEMEAKSWFENELQDNGEYKAVEHKLSAFNGSQILINATTEEKYETNIPNGKWYDTNQLNADTTKPEVDYGYMYQNYIYWEGHDDESNSATEIVSGLGKHPYGIRFDTMFPYGMDFTAFVREGTGWTDSDFATAKFEVAEFGSASYIPSGTELWFDDPIQLSMFNYNMSFDVKFTVFVRDDAGNVSDGKTVTIPMGMEGTKMDLGIGELPEDIKRLLNSESGDRTSDIDAPTLQYIYMYRGQLYIYAEDISHEGRDVSGLAPYAYQITSTVNRASSINGNASRDGGGVSYTSLIADTPIFISSPVIPIGEVPSEFALTIRVIDAAGMNGNSGPSDGNITDPIVVTLNRYSNNNVLYGNAPDSIVQMLEKEKLQGGEIGVDNVPPVIHAIYVGVNRQKSVLGVIATDNSGSPCEYSFDLRMSGTVAWQDGFEVELRDGDTGVARVYVRDKSGNETSATVFVDMNSSSVVYGDPGMIPKDILDKYNISKTDNVAPVITSVYVYNGRLYVMGYDDVALHNTPYGWRPTEDAIFSTDFTGVNDDGQPINYYAGTLVPNGTLAFNNNNSQEIQIPMSFEVTLRDTSDNRTSMTFFVSQDNTVLYGNPPKGLEDVLDKKEVDNSDLVSEKDGRLQVNMHADFKSIKWNDYDYRVQMYDSEGRLVYSVDVDEGGTVTIPYYVAGETVKIVESAVTEKDGSELLSINIDYTTKDTIAPVIDKVYIVGKKIYVDAFDNIELHKKPYSFTFENVSSQMSDNFTSENSKRVLAGDRVIVKVRDAAGNSSSVTVNVGKVEDKTLMELVNPTQSLVFSVGDNKTVSAWSEYFRSRYNLDPEYTLNAIGNDMFTFGEIDATIQGAGSGYIKLEKDDKSTVIYVSAKVKDDGATGRTAVVQTNSYTNFLLVFKDKLLEEFGTANGIDWVLDSSNKSGASKYQDYFYGSSAGIYRINASRDGKTVKFWFLVEDDINSLMDTIEFKTDSWRYVYLTNTTVTMKDIFDFTKVRNPDGSVARIIIEDIPDGVTRNGDKITFEKPGRKKIMFLNLLDGKAYTLSCQVVEPYVSIGEYGDIADSWARAEISLIAQNGILEKSNDGLFKPYNPVSVKEFLTYLDRMDMFLFREKDRDNLETLGAEADNGYSLTALELGISTKDWDYYTLNDFAGTISDATFGNVLADGVYNRPITRGEAAVLIAGSILSREPQRSNTGFNIEDVTDSNVEAAAELLASLGIVTISNNSFRPNAELTRQEMAKILGGIIKYFE